MWNSPEMWHWYDNDGGIHQKYGHTWDIFRLYPLLWRFLPAVDPQVAKNSDNLILGRGLALPRLACFHSQVLLLLFLFLSLARLAAPAQFHSQVDLFHSRDLDSRLSAREVAAVQQFLPSVAQVIMIMMMLMIMMILMIMMMLMIMMIILNIVVVLTDIIDILVVITINVVMIIIAMIIINAQVHCMRDHPAHSAVMMGGMWGAKVERTRRQWDNCDDRELWWSDHCDLWCLDDDHMTLQKEGDESGQKAKTIYDDHNGWLIMMVIIVVSWWSRLLDGWLW